MISMHRDFVAEIGKKGTPKIMRKKQKTYIFTKYFSPNIFSKIFFYKNIFSKPFLYFSATFRNSPKC